MRQRKGYTAFAVLMVCAVLLALKMCPPALREADAAQLLAQTEEIRVLSGAPEGTEYVKYTRRQLLQGTLLQVSAENPLPQDYPAPNVRGVRAVVGAYLPALEETALTRETIQALCDMQTAHPLENMIIARGGVSIAQQNLCRRDVFEKLTLVCSLEEAAARSRQMVPAGGESEHQLGTAFDVVLTGVTGMGRADRMEWNETGLWLRQNMHCMCAIQARSMLLPCRRAVGVWRNICRSCGRMAPLRCPWKDSGMRMCTGFPTKEMAA